MIDELDPENDNDKSLVWETQMPSEVTKLFFKDNQLLAVHKTGFKTFKVNQISSDQFDVNLEYSFDIDLSSKFAQIVDDQWLVMTTFPLDQKTWKSDP